MAQLKSLTIGGQKFDVTQGGVQEGGFKGLKANLPVLALGKSGYCTDTKELFIGTSEGNKLYAVAQKDLTYQVTINNTATGSLPQALKDFIATNFESIQASIRLNLFDYKIIYKGKTYSHKEPLLSTQAIGWQYNFVGSNPTLEETFALGSGKFFGNKELQFNVVFDHFATGGGPVPGFPYTMDFSFDVRLQPKRELNQWNSENVGGRGYYGVDTWDYSILSKNDFIRARFYNNGVRDNLDTDNYEFIIEAKEVVLEKPFAQQLKLHRYLNDLSQNIPYQINEGASTISNPAPVPNKPFNIKMYAEGLMFDIPKLITTNVKRVEEIPSSYPGTTLSIANISSYINVVVMKKAFILQIPLEATYLVPVGTEITFVRDTTGVVEFSPVAGVTLISAGSQRKIGIQNGVVVLCKINTNAWMLSGDLGA